MSTNKEKFTPGPWMVRHYKTGASTAIADRAAHKAEEIDAILAEARGEAR
jgi:hypothetical protein